MYLPFVTSIPYASAPPPAQHTALMYALVDGYSSPDLALHCGTMLRECIKAR